jgi:hypothetical protein
MDWDRARGAARSMAKRDRLQHTAPDQCAAKPDASDIHDLIPCFPGLLWKVRQAKAFALAHDTDR